MIRRPSFPIFSICLLLSVAVGGCQEGARRGLNRSVAQLVTPPHSSDVGRFHEGEVIWMQSHTASGASMRIFDKMTGVYTDVTPASHPVSMAGATVMVAGVRYLLVGGINAAGQFAVHRLHDVDGDDRPDTSSTTKLFDSGFETVYGTSIATVAGTDVFVFDRRCNDILRASDTDGDGWADTISGTVFARSADHAALNDVAILYAEEGGVDAPLHYFTISDSSYRPGTPPVKFLQMRDQNGDGAAEVELVVPVASTPHMRGEPYDGQSSLTIDGATGLVAEVWSVAPEGGLDQLLGSLALTSGLGETLTLVRELVNGEMVAIKYAGSNPRLVRPVRDAGPQIFEAENMDLAGGTFLVTGVNFAGAVVEVRTGDGTAVPHVATIVDGSTIEIEVESLAESFVGTAQVSVQNTTLSGEPLDLVPVIICERSAQ